MLDDILTIVTLLLAVWSAWDHNFDAAAGWGVAFLLRLRTMDDK